MTDPSEGRDGNNSRRMVKGILCLNCCSLEGWNKLLTHMKLCGPVRSRLKTEGKCQSNLRNKLLQIWWTPCFLCCFHTLLLGAFLLHFDAVSWRKGLVTYYWTELPAMRVLKFTGWWIHRMMNLAILGSPSFKVVSHQSGEIVWHRTVSRGAPFGENQISSTINNGPGIPWVLPSGGLFPKMLGEEEGGTSGSFVWSPSCQKTVCALVPWWLRVGGAGCCRKTYWPSVERRLERKQIKKKLYQRKKEIYQNKDV